jgi:riboflavin kinase/FMN adenylyltransferase
MKIIRGLHNLKPLLGSVITIGNFDGVHIAHQNIISRLIQQAKLLNLPSVLISFSPTPQRFFAREQATLSNFKQKQQLLTQLGLDIHLIINFNLAFSRLSGEDFIRQILLDKLAMRFCLIGDDFRFGAGRLGDFTLLKNIAKHQPFELERTRSILRGDDRISSSKIRAFLSQGRLKSAAEMLGRDFSISGRIIRGKQLGRTIDFPTINVPIKRDISPVLGVFGVQVSVIGKTLNGVCNVGKRPTVNGENILLEVFLFDFNQEIYGEYCTIIFKSKIRDEQKFASFELLKNRIKVDVKIAAEFFKNEGLT